MATINITVQSLLNAGQYDSYSLSDTSLVSNLKTTIQSNTGCSTTWFNLVFNNEVLVDSNTLAYYGITNGAQLRTANMIAELNTLQDRQVAKLELAQLKRLAYSDPYPYYDIDELPTHYEGNTIVDNPNPGGLIEGRPWVAAG